MSVHRPTLRTQASALHARPVPAAFFLLVLAGLAGCSSGGSQIESASLPGNAPTAAAAVRSTPVVPGRRARVFIFAGVGYNCEPIAAPQVTITESPAKGDVSFVPGQVTTIQSSAKGTCIGTKTKGTGSYYTARAGVDGTDHFSISARLASGETATRTFEVHIAK